jgi:hypothetical protein
MSTTGFEPESLCMCEDTPVRDVQKPLHVLSPPSVSATHSVVSDDIAQISVLLIRSPER